MRAPASPALRVAAAASLLAGVSMPAAWATARPSAAPTVPLQAAAASGASAAAPAGWQLPRLGPAGATWSDGVSADGRVRIFVERGAGERGPSLGDSTRFAVQAPGAPMRVITLAGRFGFDAISRDGRSLFLTENRDTVKPGTYRVRMLDIATGVLRPEPLVDRRTDLEEAPVEVEQMYGYAKARAVSATHPKWIFTLYDAPRQHPFVHALNTDGTALCIDLPAHGLPMDRLETAWHLTVGTRYLRIENPVLGKTYRVPVGTRRIFEI